MRLDEALGLTPKRFEGWLERETKEGMRETLRELYRYRDIIFFIQREIKEGRLVLSIK